jgi:hypothetical protein
VSATTECVRRSSPPVFKGHTAGLARAQNSHDQRVSMPTAPCRTLADMPVSSARDRGSADYEQPTHQEETRLEGKHKIICYTD